MSSDFFQQTPPKTIYFIFRFAIALIYSGKQAIFGKNLIDFLSNIVVLDAINEQIADGLFNNNSTPKELPKAVVDSIKDKLTQQLIYGYLLGIAENNLRAKKTQQIGWYKESADQAKDSREYFDGLTNYDKKLKNLTQPIWDKEYKK